MIKTPTVLVLGAGASMPYGFPAGNALKEIIITNLLLNPSSSWYEFLNAQNVSKDFARRFALLLQKSGNPSIDAFLATQPDFIAVGKICIALSLIPLEEEHKIYKADLYKQNNQDRWYEYLREKLHTSKELFSRNSLSIITFNYDRSIDFFLYNAILCSFFKGFAEAENVMEIISLFNSIPILHIHGQLGCMPGLGQHSRNYSPGLTNENIEIAWKQIKVASEHNYKSETYEKAYQQLCSVERIYFLGFGYHEDNLEKLALDQIKGKMMYGTSLGLGDSERETIFNRWHIHLPTPACGTLEFLKNYAKLD